MDSELPPAPTIDGEAMLEIFVHKSIRFTGMPMTNSPFGDGQRLATIGSKMLEAAYASILFDKKPMLKADVLEAELNNLMVHVEKWVDGYKWREKVRHAPEINLKDPEETRYLMDAYVGAVYVGGGFRAVLDWIDGLVEPKAQQPAQQGHYAEPEAKKYRTEQPMGYSFPAGQSSYQTQVYPPPNPYAFQMQPPPPATAPPPLPHNPLAPAQPHSAFLPLFNQTAQQRRLEVQYPAQFSGPAHAGKWTVQCLVNGIEKGMGVGPSKQLAKEEAARQAYHAMGWAPRV